MSDLQTELGGLATVLDLPQPVPMAARVVADSRVRRAPNRRPLLRPVAVGLAALSAVVVLVPGPRRAIASLLGLGGTSIVTVDELPEAVPSGLIPGQEVSLDEARARAGFPIVALETPPDRVLLDEAGPGPIVTLVHEGRLIITQLVADGVDDVLQKSVLPTAIVEDVHVDGVAGFWVAGAHTLSYLDGDGTVREVPPRLVGSTLLYARDGVTIRIETAGDLDTALRVAAELAG